MRASWQSVHIGIGRINFFTEVQVLQEAIVAAVPSFPTVLAKIVGEYADETVNAISFTVALQTNQLTNWWKYEAELALLFTWWKMPSPTVPSLPPVEEMPGRRLFDWQRASTHAMTTKLMNPPAHPHPLNIIHEQYDEESKETYLFSRKGYVTFGSRDVIDEQPIVTFITGCMLVDKTATGKERSVMYSLIDMMDKVPTHAHHHRFRTRCSAMVIVTSSEKISGWRKEVQEIVPDNWRILYIITCDDLENSDFTSADLIIVNQNMLRTLGTNGLCTLPLQFRIVVFDDVDKLVHEGAKELNTIYLTGRAIVAKTLFCGDNNILLSSRNISLERGSNHLDTCLYLAGVFQNNVTIYPGPISLRDMLMADPQNRQDIFDGGSVRHFALQEDQKLLTHGYFLEHHVLRP
jgi:hypothetical protein